MSGLFKYQGGRNQQTIIRLWCTGWQLLLQEDVLVVISDVKLPDINSVELVKFIKDKKPFVEVISLTAFGSIQDGYCQ